jgi:hypothetical protein
MRLLIPYNKPMVMNNGAASAAAAADASYANDVRARARTRTLSMTHTREREREPFEVESVDTPPSHTRGRSVPALAAPYESTPSTPPVPPPHAPWHHQG